MKLININLNIKVTNRVINFSLYGKAYSTANNVGNYWCTKIASKYRVEVCKDENYISVNPLIVTKDIGVINSTEEIVNQIAIKLSKLSKLRMFQLNKT